MVYLIICAGDSCVLFHDIVYVECCCKYCCEYNFDQRAVFISVFFVSAYSYIGIYSKDSNNYVRLFKQGKIFFFSS